MEVGLNAGDFALYAKAAEEIDLEKCDFWNSTSSVTLTLTLCRVEVILVCICGLHTHQVDRNRKNFLWTYGLTDMTSNSRSITVPVSPPRR